MRWEFRYPRCETSPLGVALPYDAYREGRRKIGIAPLSQTDTRKLIQWTRSQLRPAKHRLNGALVRILSKRTCSHLGWRPWLSPGTRYRLVFRAPAVLSL